MRDAEITHVWATAAALWVLIGVAGLVPTPERLPACALIGAFIISSVSRPSVGPRVVAKLAIALALWGIVAHDISFINVAERPSRLRWIGSSLVTLGAGAFVTMKLVEDGEQRAARILGGATYLTVLFFVWRALDPVWPPLVTTSYAVLGALLLILSRRGRAYLMLQYLGGVTMLIVAARLLLVDLSNVEAIWRVLLFIVCGALFLYTGYRMRPRDEAGR